MMQKLSVRAAIVAAMLLSVGCEEEKEAPVEETAQEQAAVEAPPEKTAEEKAAEAKLATEEAKRAEEEAKAQEELAENPLTDCCRALGQKGFTLRSPEYMAASKVCGKAMEEEKGVAEILPSIKKELKDKSTPDECQAK